MEQVSIPPATLFPVGFEGMFVGATTARADLHYSACCSRDDKTREDHDFLKYKSGTDHHDEGGKEQKNLQES